MEYEAAAEHIRTHTTHRPAIGIVTGSGLGNLADGLDDAQTIPFADIPGFPRATVEGHKGEFCFGTLKGKPVCIARGRVHFYEGYTMQQVTYYVRVLRAIGVETLLLTNAAGGLNPAFGRATSCSSATTSTWSAWQASTPCTAPTTPRGVRASPR